MIFDVLLGAIFYKEGFIIAIIDFKVNSCHLCL